MDKLEFLSELREALRGLPDSDIEERLSFYSEMIDDRIEEGLSVKEAIAEIGSVEKIRAEIIRTTPLVKIIAKKIKPRKKIGVWEIVLLVLGAPIWLSLAVAAFAVALSLYAVIWSGVISLWAVEISLISCVPAGVAGFFMLLSSSHMPTAIFSLGAGMVSGGLAIFFFFICKLTTRALLLLTKKLALTIKKLFIKKDVSK